VISVGTILHETYRIDGELGRGGMGQVFAASHTRLPRRFAVKVLMQAADEQSLRRFRREAEICSQIGHQNIVEVFDFNEVDGQPYIVMELLHGESLRQRLEREPIPPRILTIQMVREVGPALAAAHAAGVVHRDLKPENIFICRESGHEVFKVLDFGISKIIGARSLQTREDMLLGTPGYMSPEQARGDVQLVSHKTDQFALATIVYEALAGKAAFVAPEDTPYTVLYKIVHREPPPLFGQPPEVQRVLARALAKEPDQRYGDIDEFAAAMVAALQRVPETKVQARPSLPARSRPTWPLWLAAAAIIAAGATTATLLQRLRARRATSPAITTTTPPPTPVTTGAPPAIQPSLPPPPVARPDGGVAAHANAGDEVSPPRRRHPPPKTTKPAKPVRPRETDDELSNPYAPEKP
jgi:serine/threonine-protein kinase